MTDRADRADRADDLYILSIDPGTVNMAYCLLNTRTLMIKKWGLFSIKASTNEGTCIKLAEQLEILDLIEDRRVIILHEQQPRCNLKTLTICGQLQMYYTLDRIAGRKISKIVGYHAKNKIKYYIPRAEDEPMPANIDKLKHGHYKNKKVLIEHCKRILIHNDETDEWKDFLKSNKKKADDLSDSYVMACSYLKANGIGIFAN